MTYAKPQVRGGLTGGVPWASHPPTPEVAVPWFWTDDLARILVDAGLVSRERVQDWLDSPTGVAIGDGVDALEAAKALAGLEEPQVA